MRNCWIFVVLFTVLSTQIWGQVTPTEDSGIAKEESEKEKMIILPFSSPLISKYDSDYVNRLAARIVAQHGEYFLVISDSLRPKEKMEGAYSLKIDVEQPAGELLDIEAKIVSNRNQDIVKRVTKRNFNRKHFRLVAEKALLVLFGIEKETEVEESSETKEPKEKKITVIPEKNVVPNDDFRKEIMNIKTGLVDKFNKQLEEKKKKEQDEISGEDPENKKKQDEPPPENPPNIPKREDDVFARRGPQKEPGKHTFFNWYSVGANYSDFLITDRAGEEFEVVLRTNLSSLLANFYSEIWTPYLENFAYFWKLGVSVPIFYTDEVQPQSALELDFGVLAAFFNEDLYTKIGVRRDRLSFANIPILGEGVVLAQVDVTWMLISAHFLFWERKLYLRFESASQLASEFTEGDFTDGSLSAVKTKAVFGFTSSNIVKGSYFEIASQSTVFSASGERPIEGVDNSYFLLWHLPF